MATSSMTTAPKTACRAAPRVQRSAGRFVAIAPVTDHSLDVCRHPDFRAETSWLTGWPGNRPRWVIWTGLTPRILLCGRRRRHALGFWSRRCERAGYEVSDFDNGASGLRTAARGAVLAASDRYRHAVEMDGIELARRATETRPGPQGDVHHRLCRGGAQPRLEGPQATPRSCRSPSTCATSSTRSRRCWQARLSASRSMRCSYQTVSRETALATAPHRRFF